MHQLSIVHCDLKPENILVQPGKGDAVKVIDLGSAFSEGMEFKTYVQSRFYRAPEVIVGYRWGGLLPVHSPSFGLAAIVPGNSVDVLWSLG